MDEKRLEQILQEVGKEVQRDEWAENTEKHEFSKKYLDKKQELLNTVASTKTGKKAKRSFGAVAALALIACVSLTTYAAVKMISVTTSQEETNGAVTIAVDKNTDEYIPPIEISPQYLPEGYAAWDDHKYSLNGEWGLDGITIADAGYYRNYLVPDVSNYEELQIGDAKAVFITIEGYAYPWHVYLFYEATGHVVEVFGCDELSKDEIIKVCENITYKETPELDPEHTYHAFAYEEEESFEAEAVEFDKAFQMQEGDWELCHTYTEDGDPISEGVEYRVKSITISDTVDRDALNANTTYAYDEVMEYIQEDGTLVPYTYTVSEWVDGKLAEREIGTTAVKNVELVAEVKNTTDMAFNDVNMQPMWKLFKESSESSYQQLDDSEIIPGYTVDDNFRGSSHYGISNDGMAYYFDSSAFVGDSHFYNMAIAAGETKEVKMSFAIPEDQLDQAYLVFSENIEGAMRFIKVKN